MKKIIKIFVKTLFVLLVIISIVGIYAFNYVSIDKGKSMQPTLSKNNVSFGIPAINLGVGDIVGYRCFSKCDINGEVKDLRKRIIDINENGCYWFEGDNKENSYDSRDYGWLCSPDDFKLQDKTVAVWQNGKLVFIK